jgi:hypothetical protein
VSYQKFLKTLRENGCEVDADENGAAVSKATQSTPKAGRMVGSGKKTPSSRKKKAVEMDNEEDENYTPSKKARTSASKLKKDKKEDDGLVAQAVKTVTAMDESVFTDVSSSV